MKRSSYVVMECLNNTELFDMLSDLNKVRTVYRISNMSEGPMLFRIAVYGELPEEWEVCDDFDYSGEAEYEQLANGWNKLYSQNVYSSK